MDGHCNKDINVTVKEMTEPHASPTRIVELLKSGVNVGHRFNLSGDIAIDDEINRFKDLNTDVWFISTYKEIELWSDCKRCDWATAWSKARKWFDFWIGRWHSRRS